MSFHTDLMNEIMEMYHAMNEAKAKCDVIIAEKELEAKDGLALHAERYLPGQTAEIIARSLIRDDPDFKVWSGKYNFRRERMLALLALHAAGQRELMLHRLERLLINDAIKAS